MKLANLREAVISNGTASPEVSSQTVIADDHSGELPYQTTKPSMMQSTTIPGKESLIPSIRISGNEMPTILWKKDPREFLLLKVMLTFQLERLEHCNYHRTRSFITTSVTTFPSEHVTSPLTTITKKHLTRCCYIINN